MAKKNEIAVPTQSGDIATLGDKPAFLADKQMVGLEGVSRIVRPSMIRIVQKNSSDELTERFAAGSIILMPDSMLLGDPETPVEFVPIMFFQEYCKWSPMKLKGIEPMIKERTFDPNSSTARKAQNPETWSESHPQHPGDEKFNYRYVEHLNFLVKLAGEAFRHLDPVLVSFAKTNYTVGQRLGKLMMARQASIFAGKYVLGTRTRDGQETSWKVYTVDNAGWNNDEDVYNQCAAIHDQAVELIKSKQIDLNYDEEIVAEAETVPAGTGKY